MNWFRGVIQAASDTAKGVRITRSIGRGVRELRDISLMQQPGFLSIPVDGDTMLVLKANDLDVAIAASSKNKPTAAVGETVLFSTPETVVRLKPDDSVLIETAAGSKVEIAPSGEIMVHGAKVTVKGDTLVDVLAPAVGLGASAAPPNPLNGVVTRQCVCMFAGTPHPDASDVVFAAKIPS